MKIGWIGLGLIGTQMAKRLLAEKHDLTVYARGQGLDELKAAGAATSDDYRTLAAECDALIFCVYSDAQVEEVLIECDALNALRPGSIVAVHTTGSPKLMHRLQAAAPAGVQVIDATFSGGPAEAAAGTLTLMVGGETGTVARLQPVLQCYAAQIHLMGALGMGQAVKLLNNLLFATNLMNSAEMLTSAERLGIEQEGAAKLVQACSGASFAMGRLAAARSVPATLEVIRPYLEKDVRAAMSAAADLNLDLTTFRAVETYWCAAKAQM